MAAEGKGGRSSAIGFEADAPVTLAPDARLNREVAIKVLPASFAKDADRLRRFEQEARANILTIFDIGFKSDESPMTRSASP